VFQSTIQSINQSTNHHSLVYPIISKNHRLVQGHLPFFWHFSVAAGLLFEALAVEMCPDQAVVNDGHGVSWLMMVTLWLFNIAMV